MKAWRCILIGLAAVLTAGVLIAMLLRSDRIPQVSGPLQHEAYVWQRAWTPDLLDRLGEAGPLLRGVVVLSAEISWSAARASICETELDFAALKACGCPVGLVIRVGPYSGSFDENAEATRLVADVAASTVRKARAAGLTVSEIQIDFDCPESKLAGYRIWVEAVRRRVGDLPVTITALPSWLDSPQFVELVRATCGFVLQVHALRRPQSLQDIPSLCDPQRSRRWVEQAARAGVPFRVALPTYSYLLAFDVAGAYLGASAEGSSGAWAPGTQFRLLTADAEAMATLVRRWTENRPALLRGILWYRLPIESDKLNWRWTTLRAIMDGRLPRADLRVETRQVEPGLIDVYLHNAGDADARLDASVSLRWDGKDPIARDALGEFEGVELVGSQWTLRPDADAPRAVLGPGKRRMIAWMRFDTNREVQSHVVPNSD